MPYRSLRFGLSRKHPEPRMFTRHDSLKSGSDVVMIGAGDHGIHDVAVLEKGYIGAGNTTIISMTLMIGVAVLVVPENTAGGRRYRIWCDPTFGPYLGESLGAVVLECGGRYTGVSA
jgi:hypothetical protein